MLRPSVTARAVAPNEEIRRRGLFAPLMAASVLALAAAASIGSARAADLYNGYNGTPSPDEFAISDARAFSWTGLYFGGHAGWATGDVDWNVVDSPFFEGAEPGFGGVSALPSDFSVSTDLEGGIAGVHLGFNQQVGRLVFGVEGSLSGTDVDGSTTLINPVPGTGTCGGILGTCVDTVALETEADWLALATLRVGYAVDRWLLYVKGGYATADIGIRGDEAVVGVSLLGAETIEETRHFSSSEQHHGWHIGAGIEKALTTFGCCNAIIGLEYNFIDLGSERHTGTAAVFDPGEAPRQRFDIDVDPDGIHTVKARLSFKFGCCEQAAVAPLPPLK